MQRVRAVVCVVFVVLLSWASPVFAKDPLRISFPDTPAPPGSDWTWVGRQMVVDGVPMSVKNFRYRGTEAEMITHFENFWKTLSHGAYRRNKIGPKSFLSHETPDFYSTVQYEVHEQIIVGSIAVSLPLNKSVLASKPLRGVFGKPPGSRVISHVESNDFGLYSQTVTLLSKRSIQFNSNYVENQLINSGWMKISNQCDTDHCQGHYQSDKGQLQISIKDLPGSGSNGSRILIHLMKQ